MFCPDWVYDIAVAKIAHDFLANDLPLTVLAGKYADGLGEFYSAVEKDELGAAAEDLLMFLSEVQAGEEAVTFLNGFVFFRYNFETFKKPRKLNPIFGAVDDPVKNKTYSAELATKHFKAYVFGLRSNSAPVAPAGWKIDLAENTSHIAEISRKPVSILDAF